MARRSGPRVAATQGMTQSLDGTNVLVEVLARTGQSDTLDALRQHAGRRLSFAIRRFSPRIERIRVRLTDVNGPRRGVDSRCALTAHLTDGRQVFVHVTAALPLAAIDGAARRLGESLRRQLGRRRE